MLIAEAWRRLRYLVLRDRYTAELEEEIRTHIKHREASLRAEGLPPGKARYEARRRFGNPVNVEERSREMWGLSTLEHVGSDLRFAVRRLRTRPGLSVSAIIVTALGIGATTAVFSAIDAALLRPLPFAHPEQLYLINAVVPFNEDGTPPTATYRSFNVLDAAKMNDVISSVAVYAAGGLNLKDAEHPQRLRVGAVSRDFFTTLGISPQSGRTFDDGESTVKGPKAVILSNKLWRSQFGGREMIGKSIDMNGLYTVVGIMPRNFDFPNRSDVWIPMTVPNTSKSFAAFRGSLPTHVIARTAPGVTAASANGRLLAQWIALAGPTADQKQYMKETIAEVRAKGGVTPLQTALVGDSRPAMFMLVGATLLLLLIASANVANLLLTDAASRRREVALREVLGASRRRITLQLLVESSLLALVGAFAGVAVAPLVLALLRSAMPSNLAGVAPATIDLRVLGFSIVLALITGVGFGLWPALTATRGSSVETIRSGGDLGSTAASLSRARRIVITAEIALTVVLLVGAGLMLRSLDRVLSEDRGMRTEHVATLELSLNTMSDPGLRATRFREIVARLERDPGIDAAALVNDLPLREGGGISVGIRVSGGQFESNDKRTFSRYLQASSGYFNALGIPLLRGRTFLPSDGDSLSPQVAVINMTMAKLYWPNGDALGRTFDGLNRRSVVVVGIVGDTRERSLEKTPPPQVYFPFESANPSNAALIARSTLPRDELLTRIRAAVQSVDPAQAVYNVRMMDDVIAASLAPRRTNTTLITLFGGLALLLSGFGIYAVVSYSVTQRSREFGIRAALGATATSIAALVGRELVTMLGVGLAIGLAGAWALSRVIATLLYGVDPHDPATFLIVPAVLAIPALMAGWPPARRAMGVSPVEVMRAE